MNDAQAMTAARLLAIEVLLADPEALANDALEGDLYLLRDKLRGAETPAGDGDDAGGRLSRSETRAGRRCARIEARGYRSGKQNEEPWARRRASRDRRLG